MARCVPFSRFAGMSVRRLWLVDHLLRNRVGHHLGYNLAIAEASRAAGVQAVLVGQCRFDRQLAADNEFVANFRTDWRAAPPAWVSRDQRLLRILELWSAARFRSDLKRWGKSVGADDLIFAQMIAPRHFHAWLNWFSEQNEPPCLALHLGYQPHRFDTDDARGALRKLSSDHRARLILVTDSEKLQASFTQALAAPVAYLPHIVSEKFPDASAAAPAGPLRILVPGNARREKGFAELWEAVQLLGDLREGGQIEFRVQCHQPDHFCADILARARSARGLQLVNTPLAEEEYFRQFVTADVVLIPYHLDHYAMRTSGVFCEARVAGKPVLASRGSWAGDRVARSGGGWLCEEKSPADLSGGIWAALADRGVQARRAAELQEEARNEFSAASFVQGLFKLTGWDRRV